jgi:hypothetical protein
MLLLNEVHEIRRRLQEHRFDRDEIVQFGYGLSSRLDIDLLRSLIDSSEESVPSVAVSASYYAGGLSGFGASVERQFLGNASFTFVSRACSVLSRAVEDCRDSTAARALTAGYRILLEGQRPDYFVAECADALASSRRTLGNAGFDSLLDETYLGEYLQDMLVATVAQGQADVSRLVWQCKQFSLKSDVVDALEQLRHSPRNAILTTFVLSQFLGKAVDIEQTVFQIRALALDQDNRTRLVNLVVLEAIRRSDTSLLGLLDLEWAEEYDSTALAALRKWAIPRIHGYEEGQYSTPR